MSVLCCITSDAPVVDEVRHCFRAQWGTGAVSKLLPSRVGEAHEDAVENQLPKPEPRIVLARAARHKNESEPLGQFTNV